MDSEDSRDASSGSDSEDSKGRYSHTSRKSNGGESYKSRSSSRSSSPGSRAHSASSQSSAGSRPPSPDRKDLVHSRHSSKSRSIKSRSPDSRSDRSKSPDLRNQSPPQIRSPVQVMSPAGIRSPEAGSVKSRSPSPKPFITRARSSSASSSSSEDIGPRSPSIPENPERDPLVNQPKSPSPVRQLASHPRSPSPRSSSPNSSLGSPTRSIPRSPPRSPPSHNFARNRSPHNDDNRSVKSDSSASSRKSKSSRGSRKSDYSRGSRSSGRKRRKDDDITSDSSNSSVDSSSRKNKTIVKATDTQPEAISDGDIESDHEKKLHAKEQAIIRHEINISHEDLSDVSDLEDSIGGQSDNDKDISNQQVDSKVNGADVSEEKVPSPEPKKVPDKPSRPEEGEEQLDFEAEDGECDVEVTKEKDENEELSKAEENQKTEEKNKKAEEKEELEEGEVTDEDDVRPEETEPRPVCRFFSRGQCTWGASCRFLHPGVTDKGNYTMFEMIRPVVPGEFRDERVYGKVEPPVVESAWERGLRTAKEMLRKSVKRKEQDIDFEEKKMNLSLAQEEFDKENGYYGRATSPEPRYVRHVEYPVSRPQEEYYNRRQVVYEPEYVPSPSRERIRPYRELPTHRMPDYYNSKYEEEPPQQHSSSSKPRTNKPKREVIVQRAENERQTGRGDEWSDPWMRSKEAGRRKDSTGTGSGGREAGRSGSTRKRSYSSGSSYSSSSSSRSSSDSSRSSYRSRSRSLRRRRSRSYKGRPVSPSVIVSERKAANERAALMNPPAPKRRAPSPGMMRVSTAANPPAPSREEQFGRSRSKLAVAAALSRINRRRSSRSSSGSSGSSSSESDSSDSSSSSSRDNSPAVRSPAVELVKAMDALKGNALEKKQIKLNLKNPVGVKKPDPSELRKLESSQAKKRPASSPPPVDTKSKKATSRREELLKQLKAVEDAIAKKRSKVN